MANNQPPPIWSLVEKWRDQQEFRFGNGVAMADELAALLREHAERWTDKLPLDYLVRDKILGVPPEDSHG